MTTVEATTPYPSYSHPLVSWGSLILGALVAIALGVLLNLLVALFDATATLHEVKAHGAASDNGLLVGVFGGVANLIALFTGGFIAARSANHPDHHDGMLHGFGVWALSFVVAFAILGSGVSKTVGAAMGETAGGGAQAAAPLAPGGNTTAGAAPSEPPGVTAAQQQAAEADAAAETQAEAQDIAKGAAEASFWAFAAMLVGLVAALLGGIAGARHPSHWAARRVYVVRT
jgi:hypothetical protein